MKIKPGFAILAVIATLTAGAKAESIGAGTEILELPNPNIQVDTPSDGTTDQSRINIDDTFSVLLGPGEYTVPTWSYRAGQVGSVIPFLAVETAPDVYQLLTAGDQVDIDAAGLDVDVTTAFSGDNFTLAAETAVFAGIINPPVEGSQNPIYTNLASGATVDHDNNNNGAVASAIDTGMASNFAHGNLGRSYAFSVDVNVVPEPTSALLTVLFASLAIFKLRR